MTVKIIFSTIKNIFSTSSRSVIYRGTLQNRKNLQPRSFISKSASNMPLIVPGVTSGGDSKTQEWMNKLVGKKLTDGPADATSFAKQDLPKETRVIEPGMMVTKDFNPERLNVHLKEDGTVSHVDHQ